MLIKFLASARASVSRSVLHHTQADPLRGVYILVVATNLKSRFQYTRIISCIRYSSAQNFPHTCTSLHVPLDRTVCAVKPIKRARSGWQRRSTIVTLHQVILFVVCCLCIVCHSDIDAVIWYDRKAVTSILRYSTYWFTAISAHVSYGMSR